MNNKKILIIILAIVLIWFTYFMISLYSGGNSRYYISEFHLYKNDFQTIVTKMMSLNEILDSTVHNTIWIRYKNNQVLCQLNGEKIEMNQREKKAMENVVSSFNSSTLLNRIVIFKNRVTFCTEGNWYAIAYTIDDNKPQFMSTPTESFDIKIKKIDTNWYHIINN